MAPDQAECGATKYECVCRLTGEHDVHECREPSAVQKGGCQGRWRDDGSIIRYPTGETDLAAALATALRLRARRGI